MKFIYQHILISILFVSLFSTGCEKDFLDTKPSSDLVVPKKLSDFQSLMDYDVNMMTTPDLGELSSDDLIQDYTQWSSSLEIARNAYIFSADIYNGNTGIESWNAPYAQVLVCNIILEGIGDISITAANKEQWQRIKGSAFFMRAHAYYNLVQTFCLAYDKSTAAIDLGVPIRLQSDVNLKVKRATLQENYSQILSDLTEALNLLSNNVDYNYPNRPSKTAVYALLARIYLSMRDYEKAAINANLCLQIHNKIIDYNTLSTTSTRPFPLLNDEVIYQSYMPSTFIQVSSAVKYRINPDVFASYDQNDLRKSVFFKLTGGAPYKISGYHSRLFHFSGLATDEILLIRAECYARANQPQLAMDDLNTLLVKRFKTGSYTPLSASSPADALNKVLAERRKELIIRGLRWTDLRRFNKEGANISVKRVLNGQEYVLPPNDKKYALPIPQNEISISGIEQNPR